ncbi:MAG: hypothetical protein VXZ72_01645 [Chlamydiota bacterium]|nr:hypothetical protein [Chlamydiota bacterium]
MFLLSALRFHQITISFLFLIALSSFFVVYQKKEQEIKQLREDLGHLRAEIERAHEHQEILMREERGLSEWGWMDWHLRHDLGAIGEGENLIIWDQESSS